MRQLLAGAALGAVLTLALHYAFLRGDLWVTMNGMQAELRSCYRRLVVIPPGTYHLEDRPWGDGSIMLNVTPRPPAPDEKNPP